MWKEGGWVCMWKEGEWVYVEMGGWVSRKRVGVCGEEMVGMGLELDIWGGGNISFPTPDHYVILLLLLLFSFE